MKNIFKKSFAVLLTAIIILSVNMTAFAAASQQKMNVYAGQQDVKLVFTFPKIAGIQGTVSYTNPSLLSSVKFTITGLSLGKYNDENKTFAFGGSDAVDCTITLTVKVAAGAKVGDTCGVTLKYETTTDGRMPSKPDYKYDTTTLTVVEKLDHSALKSAIEKAEKLKKTAYTSETWSKLETALSSAKKVLNSATTQKALNDAEKSLNDAINALEKLPDYTELLNQIKIAEALKKSDYTTKTWDVLADALAAAKNAKNSKKQTEIDSAAKALKNAIAGLKSIYEGKLSYDELNKQIAAAQKLSANDYEVEGWNKMQGALTNALKAKNSKLQPEIDVAAKELKNAIANLVKIDYSRLSAAIDAVNDYFNNNDLLGLINSSSDLLKQANSALTSRDQKTVDDFARRLEDYLLQIKKAVTDLAGADSVVVEKPVEVQPDNFCSIPTHKLWIVLFWISFAINLAGGILVWLYFRTKKKMATDDTPLVDYDITDDYKSDN